MSQNDVLIFCTDGWISKTWKEVLALQDWREKATGRLKTLEKRAAWAFLGVAGEGVASQAGVFKV